MFKEIEDQYKNKLMYKESRIERIRDQFIGFKNDILRQSDAIVAQRRDFIEKELGLKDKDGRDLKKGRIPRAFIDDETSPGKYKMPRDAPISTEKSGFSIKATKVSDGQLQLSISRE